MAEAGGEGVRDWFEDDSFVGELLPAGEGNVSVSEHGSTGDL